MVPENIYAITNSYLHKETIDCLNGHSKPIDNLALKLNKTVNFISDRNGIRKPVLYKMDNSKGKCLDMELFASLDTSFNLAKTNQENTIRHLNASGYAVEAIPLSPANSRLIIGLGAESVYETSITLHPVYGIPYIPGQAVKGVVRNWVISWITDDYFKATNDAAREQALVWEKIIDQADFYRIYENYKKAHLSEDDFCQVFKDTYKQKAVDKKKTIIPSDILYNYLIKNGNIRSELNNFWQIFGSQTRQGKYIFFDAFPTGKPDMRLDIMNPHYSKYYNGRDDANPPADYYNPVPIHFLTIEKTEFCFFIGIKKKHEEQLNKTEIPVEKIKRWLIDALTNHGIGAKTAVGYGYFQEKKTQ